MLGLIERALQKDSAAEREIHDMIRRIARTSCRRNGTSNVNLDWEDVAQEAGRRFFEISIHKYRGEGSEEGYVRAIVRTTMLQVLRSEKRRNQRESHIELRLLQPPNAETLIDVSAVLKKLSDECAELLVRLYLAGDTYTSLASEMEMLESSVRTRASRCLRRARKITEAGT